VYAKYTLTKLRYALEALTNTIKILYADYQDSTVEQQGKLYK
jgi:hypothetical protein